MKVVALRQLYGSYGLAATGEEIEVGSDAGAEMLKNKLVCLPDDYEKQYEKKIIVLAENKSGRARETKKKSEPVKAAEVQQPLLTDDPDAA